MDEDKNRMPDNIYIQAITPELKDEATAVLVEAFKAEEITAYHLDMSRPATPRRMALLDGIFVQLFLEAGRPALAAMENGSLIGMGMVRDPDMPISKKRAAALTIPNIFQLLALVGRRPLRGLRIMLASRHPKGLTKPYLTFEVLGVHPDHQGKGVGKTLMREVQALVREKPAVSGIYLTTGSEKNRAFYESLEYDTLRVDDIGALKIFHMFWENPSFG